jgi:hypothetical protein
MSTGRAGSGKVATHLAVGDRVDPDGLLERDRLVHGAVFDFFELSSREPASGILLSGGLEIPWA